MSFLIDSDICSGFMKGDHAIGHRFVQHSGRLYASTVTLGELQCWVLRAGDSPKRRQELSDLLSGMTVLHVDEEVGYKYGELRAHLFDRGMPSPALDLFIAATALVHDLVLVTHNTKDFRNIPGLALEDWLAP